jgi:DNA modification methylase
LAALKPNPDNARTHSNSQIAGLVASMKRWGWTIPLLIDEDHNVLAGHGRLLAAQRLGWTEAPAMMARGWSSEDKRAYAVADNKLALNADWDYGLLRPQLADLRVAGFDMSLLGFSNAELRRVMGGQFEDGDADHASAPAAAPISCPGDLWELGDHRLICGDATDNATVAKLFGGCVPALMVTDPPYGVQYDPSWRERSLASWKRPRAIGKVQNDDRADWREAWELFPGPVVYVWHGAVHAAAVQQSLEAAGFEIRSQIIWVKQAFVIGRGHYHWQHEPCWYAVRKGSTAAWAGGRQQSTVWEIQNASAMGGRRDDTVTGHGTQKPVECMLRAIENHTLKGEAVYDPFMGSGTTIIAAEHAGRRAYGCELDCGYVDVAIKRWQNLTGKEARLIGGGTFAEVAIWRDEEDAGL